MPVETKTIPGPGFTGTVFSEGDAVFELTAGCRPLLRFGRARCGGFSEEGALLKKFRLHASLDSLSASIDTASVIPFGCEYLVSRELEMVAGLALWTISIRAVTGGIVNAVELEPVTFPGPWRTIEFLIYGEKDFRQFSLGKTGTDFYRGRELVLSVRLTAEDDTKVEFHAGGDLWRHRTAMHRPEVLGEYALFGNADQVVLTRNVFAFQADTIIEKRPWKFRNSFAWSLVRNAPDAPENETVLDFAAAPLPESGRRIRCGGKPDPHPCLTSPTARRIFRDFVRHSASNLRIEGLIPGCCCAAAHLERPGKKELEHLDLDDCIHFYLWGNRQLAQRGHHLRIAPAMEGAFVKSVCTANLGEPPRLLREE